MKWYNCWLFHTWGRWSDPQEGTIKLPWDSNPRDTEVQGRKCEACNERQLRKAQ